MKTGRREGGKEERKEGGRYAHTPPTPTPCGSACACACLCLLCCLQLSRYLWNHYLIINHACLHAPLPHTADTRPAACETNTGNKNTPQNIRHPREGSTDCNQAERAKKGWPSLPQGWPGLRDLREINTRVNLKDHSHECTQMRARAAKKRQGHGIEAGAIWCLPASFRPSFSVLSLIAVVLFSTSPTLPPRDGQHGPALGTFTGGASQ